MKAKLIRVEETAGGTIGVLTLDGEAMAVTLELPDRGNAQDVSCIPPGRYVCRRVESPRFGRTFEVTGVSGRSHILFHKGNTDEDTHGCILLGEKFGKLKGDRAVLNSGATFAAFLDAASAVEQFDLLVVDQTEGFA